MILVWAGSFLWDLASLNTRYQIEAERHTTHYSERTSEQIKESCTPSNPLPRDQCIEEIIKASHENQRNEADLYAQRQMADWAYAITVIGSFSIFLTIAGIYFVRESLIEMQRTRKVSEDAVKAALQQVKIQLRPKITANQIAMEVVADMPLAGHLILVNEGGNSAEIIYSSCYVRLHNGPLPQIHHSRPPLGSDVPVLCNELPDRKIVGGQSVRWEFGSEVRLTNSQVAMLKSKRNKTLWGLYVDGIIRYEGEMGGYVTLFCRRYDPKVDRYLPVKSSGWEYRS